MKMGEISYFLKLWLSTENKRSWIWVYRVRTIEKLFKFIYHRWILCWCLEWCYDYDQGYDKIAALVTPFVASSTYIIHAWYAMLDTED